MTTWSKRLFIFSTIFAPYYFIFSTNFSIYEILLILSFISLLIENKNLEYPRFLTIALLLVIIGYILSVLTAVDKLEAIKFPLQMSFILIVQFGLIFTHIRNVDDLRPHLSALLLTLVIHVLFFVYTFIEIGVPRGRYRYTLFYENPNHLSQVLLLLIGSSLSYLFLLKKKVNILWYLSLLCVFLAIILLVLTLSRSGMLSLALLLFIFGVTNFGKVSNVTKLLSRTIIASITSIGAFVLFYTFDLLPTGVMIRISETTSLDSSKVLNRIVPWRVTIRNFQEFLITGFGYNNFSSSKLIVRSSEHAYMAQPHNMFLMSFVEGGTIALLGLILFFTYFVWLLIVFGFQMKSTDEQLLFCIGIVIIPYLFANQFGTLSVHRLFWLYIGMSASSLHILSSINKSKSDIK